MRDYLDQVRRASDAHLYYIALAGALIIPDMCGAMELPDGEAKGPRYISWFDRYIAPKYGAGPEGTSALTGDDCYGLRCSLIHQGRLKPHKGSYSRVLFIEPGAARFVAHNNVMRDALNIDVRLFISDMLAGAEAWLEHAEGTAEYKQNYGKAMQRYAEGLPPYITDVPVIA